ncbi:MAG: FAD-dependent monooxygenase [Cyclobacteriaceae bacterium]|nr:FAD-dependent monooxygenase [Cyclobacteriaceae bacterium SS2]
MQSQHTPILIIGGGIAGLTMAIGLQQNGIDALIAEAAPEFKPVGAGLVLAANAMKAYQVLGLEKKIAEAGNALNEIDILDHKGKSITSTDLGSIGDGTPNVAIHRAALHQVLLKELKAENILNGFRSQKISQVGNQYQVTFENGHSITCDHLISAEGIHAIVRDWAFPGSKLRYSGYTCWRGIAEKADGVALDKATETWGPSGRFGIVPVGDGKVYWFAVKNGPENSEELRSYSKEDLINTFSDYHAPIPALIRDTNPDTIIFNDIIDLKPIPRFAKDNLVLIGDAAHATTPNMGQGACQAIEDAVILADCIKNGRTVARAFTDFERRRLKRTHQIVNRSWTLGKIGQLENPALINLRNLLLRSMPPSINRKNIEKIYDFKI